MLIHWLWTAAVKASDSWSLVAYAVAAEEVTAPAVGEVTSLACCS